jgi:uncharacterized protein (DUF1501 family)
MQTGRAFTDQWETPHVGCLAGTLRDTAGDLPAHVLLPAPLRVPVGRQDAAARPPTGQTAGCLGTAADPVVAVPRRGTARHRENAPQRAALARALDLSRETAGSRQRYGDHLLGRCCLAARRLVESGVRCVTVNTATDLTQEPNWDAHGRSPFGTIEQLRNQVALPYDQAVAALIEDLDQRGLLGNTLVCCLAEFGRTPRMNPDGGRDHWPQCFTTYFAGGGVRGGQVIGASDAIASEPVDRPVAPGEITATILHALGVTHAPGSLADASSWAAWTAAREKEPIWELF